MADEAIQKVDGEFSEEEVKKHQKEDRKLAHKYFVDKIQVSLWRGGGWVVVMTKSCLRDHANEGTIPCPMGELQWKVDLNRSCLRIKSNHVIYE